MSVTRILFLFQKEKDFFFLNRNFFFKRITDFLEIGNSFEEYLLKERRKSSFSKESSKDSSNKSKDGALAQ